MRLSWWQRYWVVSASDSQSSGPGFKSCSDYLLDLFSVVLSLNLRLRLQIANRLPSGTWGIYWFLGVFTCFYYLSGMPVNQLDNLSALSTINNDLDFEHFSWFNNWSQGWQDGEHKTRLLVCTCVPCNFNSCYECTNTLQAKSGKTRTFSRLYKDLVLITTLSS